MKSKKQTKTVVTDAELDKALEILAKSIAAYDSSELITDEPIFKALANIEGIDDYFRDMLNNDMARSFNTPETDVTSRCEIRGGFRRSAYMWARIKKARTT